VPSSAYWCRTCGGRRAVNVTHCLLCCPKAGVKCLYFIPVISNTGAAERRYILSTGTSSTEWSLAAGGRANIVGFVVGSISSRWCAAIRGLRTGRKRHLSRGREARSLLLPAKKERLLAVCCVPVVCWLTSVSCGSRRSSIPRLLPLRVCGYFLWSVVLPFAYLPGCSLAARDCATSKCLLARRADWRIRTADVFNLRRAWHLRGYRYFISISAVPRVRPDFLGARAMVTLWLSALVTHLAALASA